MRIKAQSFYQEIKVSSPRLLDNDMQKKSKIQYKVGKNKMYVLFYFDKFIPR